MTSAVSKKTVNDRIATVERLAAYARRDVSPEGVFVGLDAPELNETHRGYLQTKEGFSDLVVWADKFDSAIDDLEEFRRQLRRSRESISAVELAAASKVVDTMLASLIEWLDSSPHLAA